MIKVVGIVGYKDSGKTTLTHALARELIDRGHQVAVIKHASHHLDLPGKDTSVLGESVGQVAIISPRESGIFWKRSLSLEDMIPYLEASVILVEGFKAQKTFPKVVCLRGQPDDGNLLDGLSICAVGPSDHVAGAEMLFLDRDDVGAVADLVELKAFKLPNLDCGGCGNDLCYDLARQIVAGDRIVEDCVALSSTTEIRIDGRPMPMNPFVSGIVKGTILGLLASLKGFRKGKIEISI